MEKTGQPNLPAEPTPVDNYDPSMSSLPPLKDIPKELKAEFIRFLMKLENRRSLVSIVITYAAVLLGLAIIAFGSMYIRDESAAQAGIDFMYLCAGVFIGSRLRRK